MTSTSVSDLVTSNADDSSSELARHSSLGTRHQPVAIDDHGHENRPRPVAVQTDCPREDTREPAEVHHPRRDDRPQREAIWSAFRCRSSTCRIFATARTAAAASGQGDGEDRPADRRRAIPRRRRRGPGRQRSGPRTSWKSISRSKSWPRSWAMSWSCRGSSPRARRTSQQDKSKYTSIRRIGPGVAAALQAAPISRRCRRQITDGHLRARASRGSCRSRTTSAIARGARSRAGGQRGHHLHDGRLAAR